MWPITIAYPEFADFPTYVYVLECGDGSLYAGVTRNFQRRLKQHKEGRGKGAIQTRQRGVKSVAQLTLYPDRASALDEERELIECLQLVDTASVHEYLLRE